MPHLLAAFLLALLLDLLVLCIALRRCPPARSMPSQFPDSMELLRRVHDDKDRRKRRAEHEHACRKLQQVG